jgi:arylsulfatase B
VREGNWKLIRPKGKPAELYDLATDVGESKDLSAAQPEVVSKLSAELDAWDKELIAPVFGGLAAQRAKAAKKPAAQAPR